MTKSAVSAVATVLNVAICAACSDRLTAPEAVELVHTVEQSLAPGGMPQRWLGDLWKSDLRLGAPLRTTHLQRDGEKLPYRAIVFERVVLSSGHLAEPCVGTRRAAYFWRADSDGVVFFPGGLFDQRLVPSGCLGESVDPLVTAITPEQGMWIQAFVEGDISPGVVTGPCGFLEPEAERVLRKEHGITCELTNHRMRFAAQLLGFAVAGPDSMRLSLDTTEILGVRYTINCDAAASKSTGPCDDRSARPL